MLWSILLFTREHWKYKERKYADIWSRKQETRIFPCIFSAEIILLNLGSMILCIVWRCFTTTKNVFCSENRLCPLYSPSCKFFLFVCWPSVLRWQQNNENEIIFCRLLSYKALLCKCSTHANKKTQLETNKSICNEFNQKYENKSQRQQSFDVNR